VKDAIKTAGVTFNNPDGESRQEILKSLGADTYITVNLIKQSFFNEQTQMPELAIACIEKNTKKQIGFIPRTDIEPEILKIRQLTGLVSVYQNTFFCVLTAQQTPDTEMYEDMKKTSETRGIPMPAYDTRAYIQFIDALEETPKHAQIGA
jgi:hypothetical protein